jgi:hypothetical protein
VSGPGVTLVASASRLATTLLHAQPDRLRHTAGVARRAGELTPAVPPGQLRLVIAAAWLHDIGYSTLIADTGFHPLDGAVYLRQHGWPEALVALVAHHSGAQIVADSIGLGPVLRQFRIADTDVADVLTYADQTTGLHGERLPIQERMADMLRRHGPNSPQARVHHERGPYLLAIADRVEARLRTARSGP